MDFVKRRVRELNMYLDELYDQKHVCELERLDHLNSGLVKRGYKNKIKDDILPQIVKHEIALSEIISKQISDEKLADLGKDEIDYFLDNIRKSLSKLQIHLKESPPSDLKHIKEKIVYLDKNLSLENIPVEGKVKLVLTIIPFLLAYELELNTKDFFFSLWNKMKTRLLGLLLK